MTTEVTIPEATLAHIQEREGAILGHPPRMAALDRESVAEQVQATTKKLRGAMYADAPPLPLEIIPEIMFVLCKHQALWDAVMALSMELFQNGTLPVRDCELAVLRTGWLLGAPYEFGEHVARAKKAGVTAQEIDRLVEEGSAWDGWSVHDRAILKASEELRADVMITDETWAVLAQSYTEDQLFELCVLVGQFTNVAYFQNALRLRLEPRNPGLSAR
ncbi:carboxymuconolactone decarboxylase family protein [Sphingobium boeckii]|uniref:Alkylhydroperoxidase family enzyme n=1 Tax=Sphingobium boeckii TaxID=1082345 RepID=A0A7W9AHX0_9SPHN|nr:carboxymuconolactone decarboxylase family protein [Sphingobium boeckii]MBB5685920.1 alkylhydroperoxidase family enzyme [Sphingobium boeckii]